MLVDLAEEPLINYKQVLYYLLLVRQIKEKLGPKPRFGPAEHRGDTQEVTKLRYLERIWLNSREEFVTLKYLERSWLNSGT